MRGSGRRITALCLVLVCAAGCVSRVHSTHGAEAKLKGKVLVAPFRERRAYYYDSEDGRAVAAAASGYLERNAGTAPVDWSKARGPVRAKLTSGGPEKEDWALIAREAGADYIIHGSIDSLGWQNPNNPQLPRCVFTITYSAIRASDGKEVYHNTRSGVYPAMMLGEGSVSVYEMGPEGLRRRALDNMGKVVARTFYNHTLTRFEADAVQEGPTYIPK